MAKYITTVGTVCDALPADGKTFTLEEMQTFVDGYIEILHTRDSKIKLIVNEEGKLHGLAPNEMATRMTQGIYDDVIVGNVLLVSWDELEH